MTDLVQEIMALKEKAANFERWNEEKQLMLRQLKEINENVLNMIKTLDPVSDMGREGRTVIRGQRGERARELYEKMVSGTHMTRNLIRSTYDIDNATAGNIMTLLKTMPNVKAVKDGVTLRLYI